MEIAGRLTEMLAPYQLIFAVVGTLVVLCGLFQAASGTVRGAGPGAGIMNGVAGIVCSLAPQIFPAAAGFLERFVFFVTGTETSDDQSTQQPEPAPVDSAPSGPADLSWVPGVLVIAGVVAAAVVTGLGLLHYYRNHLSPSLAKARSEAATAATLVATAREKLKQVVLDSASYEMDLGKQIDYPMMTDVTVPAVGKYVREMRQAQEQERALVKKPLLADAERFSNTVTCLKISFDHAVRQAERVRWSSFSVAEQRRLKDARIALDVIQDSSTTAEQRNAQYKRISKLLDGLIVLTEPVRQSLSVWVPMLALGTGSTIPTGATSTDEKSMVSAR